MYNIESQEEETLKILVDISETLQSLKSFEYGFDQFDRPEEVKPELSPFITEAMRELSYSLENLVVYGVVDVSLFFRAIQKR